MGLDLESDSEMAAPGRTDPNLHRLLDEARTSANGSLRTRCSPSRSGAKALDGDGPLMEAHLIHGSVLDSSLSGFLVVLLGRSAPEATPLGR